MGTRNVTAKWVTHMRGREMVTGDTTHLLAELERIARVVDDYRVDIAQDGGQTQSGEFDPVEEATPATPGHSMPVQTGGETQSGTLATGRRNRQAGKGSRLTHLVESFGLSAHHRDVLLLAVLPVVYPSYQSVFAELQNDLTATQPTVGLVADLFSTTDAEFVSATRLVGSESPLWQHDLIRIGEPDSGRLNRTERPVFLEERVESYLLGHESIDPVLESVLTSVPTSTSLGELRLEDDHRAKLRSLADENGARRYYWYGPPGTKKGQAVEAVVSADQLLRVDVSGAIEDGLLARVKREAILLDRPLHLTSVTETTCCEDVEITVDDILETFEGFPRPLVMTGTEEWTPDQSTSASVDAMVEFPRPGFRIRRQFWEDHTDELPAEVDPAALGGMFKLTQGDLETALATAQSLAGEGSLRPEHVYRGCSAQSAGELGELAEQLEPSATWDDIELHEDTMRELRTVGAHVTHSGEIYSEWAFEERFSRGSGVVALFAGPSGTGKTMAAEIIASETGMELYKIDLSSVVSKYIGETEENLERIFTEAEHSNAILLFDEADAVFGDRSSVSDSTDRYANVEVNYLLQRVESYDGVVLLTTNYESNIDNAFMRRIDHNVSFKRPQKETRLAIWKNIFPDETPVGDIDWEFLASFKLTGGDIRTIAQTAAILAANDTKEVTMKHAVRGLQRELEKSGKMVDPQKFDQYREHLYR